MRKKTERLSARLDMILTDRAGLIGEITGVLAGYGIRVSESEEKPAERDGFPVCFFRATLRYNHEIVLTAMIMQLEKVRGIIRMNIE